MSEHDRPVGCPGGHQSTTRQGDRLSICAWWQSPDQLNADLGKLPVRGALRALVAEDRPTIAQSDRKRLGLEIFEIGAQHGGSPLGSQREFPPMMHKIIELADQFLAGLLKVQL